MKVFLLSSFSRCELNAALASRWARYLEDNGHEVAGEAASSDWLVLASCGFDKRREDKTRALIRHVLASLRPGQRFMVTGCFPGIAGLDGRKGKALYVPYDDAGAVDAVFKTRRAFESVSVTRLDRRFHSPTSLNLGEAYLLIAEGCAFSCTYCFIKKSKGGVRSRPAAAIVDEYLAERRRGASEFVLLADDAASYGLERGEDLVALLRALRQADAGAALQIQYFHPGLLERCFEGLLPFFETGFVRAIDIPLQTTSPRLLGLMRRAYDPAAVLALVKRAKAAAPAARFQTQMIAGFPTETDEELRRSAFDALGAFDRVLYFAYEHRDGVEASALPPVSAEALARRCAFLSRLAALAPQNAFVCDALPGAPEDAASLLDEDVAREWREHDALERLRVLLRGLAPESSRLVGWEPGLVLREDDEVRVSFRRAGERLELRLGFEGPQRARRLAVRRELPPGAAPAGLRRLVEAAAARAGR